MNREGLLDWIEAYERLWRHPGTHGLSEIFSRDAVYSMGPYEEPVRGLAAISELWERERVAADEEFEMSAEAVALDGDTAVARVEVAYGPPRDLSYRDLWVLRFDGDGRCARFEEWPFWPEQRPLPEVER
ncbi:hypothetical protein BH20ACT15_BH20ACT15_08130 [soil metagenome]